MKRFKAVPALVAMLIVGMALFLPSASKHSMSLPGHQSLSDIYAQAGPAFSVAMFGLSGNPCLNPGATSAYITGVTSGTAATQVIALSGTTKIYVCGLRVVGTSGTTPTFSLVQGTGTNCATGQTVVVPATPTAAGVLLNFGDLRTVGVAGNALCYLQTGTTPISAYMLTTVQQ